MTTVLATSFVTGTNIRPHRLKEETFIGLWFQSVLSGLNTETLATPEGLAAESCSGHSGRRQREGGAWDYHAPSSAGHTPTSKPARAPPRGQSPSTSPASEHRTPLGTPHLPPADR